MEEAVMLLLHLVRQTQVAVVVQRAASAQKAQCGAVGVVR